MRGEHDAYSAIATASGGSSPHARGALRMSAARPCPHGIIPACAGSTAHQTRGRASGRDHPRMRGEHQEQARQGRQVTGSSPHARGAPCVGGRRQVRAGIIPACAGSTSAADVLYLSLGDHPRMRGEHLPSVSSDAIPKGSSPHARGARRASAATSGAHRIIPACAGSTSGSSRRGAPRRDHPRMRGEHLKPPFQMNGFVGSSPHARGAPAHKITRGHGYGIIPACAGSTPWRTLRASDQRDHPRMRGEHCAAVYTSAPASGSSPHARGARSGHLVELRRDGIIPACAGSTRWTSTGAGTSWDHPRMRGEHVLFLLVGGGNWGSSPHARGAPLQALGTVERSEIIPACAGSTSVDCRHCVGVGDHPRMRGEHKIQ